MTAPYLGEYRKMFQRLFQVKGIHSKKFFFISKVLYGIQELVASSNFMISKLAF